MKVGKYWLSVFFLLFFLSTEAQIVRGTVRDADSGAPLTGATVLLQRAQSGADSLRIASGPSGEFQFEGLRTGYYRCKVFAEGYESQSFTEISVAAGKDQTLEIGLVKANTTLPNVTITTSSPGGRRPLQPLSEIPLSRDQTLRFPAVYFDPARLAMAYPGLANTDDGNNGMSIRGNNPASVHWRLEGVDVVNPNHLSNSGTFNDRPAGASGGILMFSAQLLDNSSLLTGAFPAGFGDALGGVMDLNLRRGNTRRHEFTAQAGLIGLDLAAEGPMSKKGRNSYLANYRYSTVGLLGKMGISFGDEQIDFQDLSFKLNFSGKKGGEWSLFGLGAISENKFRHKSDTSFAERVKDFFDIDFTSKTGIVGLSCWSPLGQKTWLKTALAVSAQTNRRTAIYSPDSRINERDETRHLKTSGTVTLSHRLNNRWRFQGGALLTAQDFRAESDRDTILLERPDHGLLSMQPWTAFNWTSQNERTLLQIGLHSLLVPELDHSAVEPRLFITQVISKRHRLALSWGKYSEIAPLWLLKNDLKVQASWQAGLRHTWNVLNSWTLKTELFWQKITTAGIEANGSTAFSLLNVRDFETSSSRLVYNGLGENKGIEISLERYLSNNWFVTANTTIFDSRFRGSDGIWRDTRWNLGHLANLTVGREWYRERGEHTMRSFGINGRIVWTGGFREMPVDAAASEAAPLGTQSTIFDTRNGFSLQQSDYYRVDLRVYWKRSLGNRRNSTLAMDLQNVTMKKNIAYHYYDPFTKKTERKYQLGLIPNISWRLEF